MGPYVKDEKDARLESEWQLKLPCSRCPVASICKYRGAIKRVDYPPDVFDLNITCKISHKYTIADLNDQSDKE